MSTILFAAPTVISMADSLDAQTADAAKMEFGAPTGLKNETLKFVKQN